MEFCGVPFAILDNLTSSDSWKLLTSKSVGFFCRNCFLKKLFHWIGQGKINLSPSGFETNKTLHTPEAVHMIHLKKKAPERKESRRFSPTLGTHKFVQVPICQISGGVESIPTVHAEIQPHRPPTKCLT